MDYTKLINYINAKRDDLGWSINELGRHCQNLSASQIANVLGGRSAPGLDFFVQVANALPDTSPVHLLTLAGIIPAQPEPENRQESELLAAFRMLCESDRETIVRIVMALRPP